MPRLKIFIFTIYNFVLPTELESVISSVKGKCPNQLDEGSITETFIRKNKLAIEVSLILTMLCFVGQPGLEPGTFAL